MFRHFSQPKRTSQLGLTIVEFVVYIAVLVIVMVASVSYLFSIQGILTEYQLETQLYRSGTASMEQIVLTLRQADSFDAIDSVTASANGVLVVENASTTQFARVGNELQLEIDGVSYGDITGEGVLVDGFTVYRYRTTAGEFVRVVLELRATEGASTRSETFYGGSVLRGAV